MQTGTQFALRSVRDQDLQEWDGEVVTAHLGARKCSSECTGENVAARYPSVFNFCPNCGNPLLEHKSYPHTWLPPFGNDPGRQKKPTGLRLTGSSLLLAEGVSEKSKAESVLPLPQGGRFQFLVSPFGTKAPSLVALDLQDGLIFARTGGSQDGWSELHPIGHGFAGWSASSQTWAMVAENIGSSGRLWIPTDHGLCELTIDILGLKYKANYFDGKCLGAPTSLAGQVLFPSIGPNGRVVLRCIPMTNGDVSKADETVEVGGELSVMPRIFRSVTGASKRVIWEAEEGYLLVSTLPRGGVSAELTAWPEGGKPWFALGAPYCDKSGALWRQCRSSNGRISYVNLGKEAEQWPTDGPRFCTGGLSFRLGAVIYESSKPWDEVQVETSAQGRITIPIIEHDMGDVAVCAEVDESGDIEAMLNSAAKHKGRYCLRGNTRRDFLNFELARPWNAYFFVWDGYLYLYHEDMDQLHGWRLAK